MAFQLPTLRHKIESHTTDQVYHFPMYDYKAPLRDSRFVYLELLDFEDHYRSLDRDDLNADLICGILEEAAKFAEGELAPLNQTGDREGCSFEDGRVTTPAGFRDAWNTYRDNGWPGMEFREEEGGQGLPESLRIAINEYFGSANWAWNSLIGFGSAGSKCLRLHAGADLQEKVIQRYASGECLGTMCLTEPHCGTDLGMLRSKAVPTADGSYRVTGTKIFITSGDHDLTDNIIHLVLARIEGATSGTRGISLFVVPKLHLEGPDEGQPNGVACGAIEHKMGIKGSATCVLNFDGAVAYLVGEENRGLPCMFPMMNAARIGTGQQGLCHAELGLQKSVGYARDRLQMRAATGPQNPDSPADPIIVHPDVRRMLLTQKAIAEGGRMLVGYCARLVDQSALSADEGRRTEADAKLAFLTPIVKALLTELGFESANLGMQCFGGHGYIQEWGMEQNVRDARIAMLYEGTTGIQALDLLGRKVLGTGGKAAAPALKEIAGFCGTDPSHPHSAALQQQMTLIQELTAHIGKSAMEDANEVGAASVDYLMLWGYTLLGYLWARAARKAQEVLDKGASDPSFYEAKIQTANFFFEKILPRSLALETQARNGASSLMAMDEDAFLSQI